MDDQIADEGPVLSDESRNVRTSGLLDEQEPQGPSNPYADRMLRELQQPQPQDPQQPQAPANPYADRMLRELKVGQQQRQDQFMAAYGAALKADPEIAAEAQRIAAQIGAPADVVESNIDVARELVKRQAVQYQDLQKNHPVLLQQLSKVKFRRIAHDDIDNLKTTESTFGRLKRDFQSGRATNERGYIGVRQAIGLATLDEVQRRYEIDRELQQAGKDTSFTGEAAKVVGQMSGTLPLALAAGGTAAAGAAALGQLAPFVPEEIVTVPVAFSWATGAAVFSQSALIEGGNAYLDMIDKGYDPKTASVVAFGVGAVNGALEVVGFRMVAAPVKKAFAREIATEAAQALTQQTAKSALRTFAKDYAQGLAGEVGTEALQEVSGILGDELARALGSDKASRFGSAEGRGEMIGQVAGVAAATAKAMALLAVPGPALRFAVDGVRARAAEAHAKDFQILMQHAIESKVNERNPEAYAQTVQAAAAGGVENYYFDASRFGQVLEQAKITPQQLALVLPDVAAQLADAQVAGGDIVIPVGQFMGKLAKTEFGQVLMQHARPDAGAASLHDAEVYKQEANNTRQEIARFADSLTEADEAVAKSAKLVEDQMRQQLTALGRYRREEVEAGATLYRDFATVAAAEEQMLPDEWMQKHGLTVLPAEQAEMGEAFQQGATESDAFKAWFGASKVVDPEGKPVRVFHGTSRSGFTEFDTFGSNYGLMGMGSYFTENPDVASAYTKKGRGTEQGVYPTFLSIKHPIDMEATADVAMWSKHFPEAVDFHEGGTTNESWFRAAEEFLRNEEVPAGDGAEMMQDRLRAMGFDGITHVGGGRVDADSVKHRVWIAFDPEQVKSASGNRGTFDPKDPNILHQKGEGPARGAFDPRRLLAAFGKDADFSTFIHESAHYFLTVYLDMAGRPNASDGLKARVQTLLDWFKVKDLATWNAMTLEQQRKHHEAFAYSFEIYLSEGKAPTLAMQGLFRRFGVWLRRIYKSLIKATLGGIYQEQFGEALPELTNEVRQVMGRMLASELEIQQAEVVRNMVPLFQTREQAGMDESQWQAYQAALEEARNAAIDDLTRKSVRQMRWLSGAKGRLLREMQAETAAVREQVRAEVAGTVAQDRVYRLQAFLERGVVIGPDGKVTATAKNHKLNTAAVHAMFPDPKSPERRRLDKRGKGSLLAKDGQLPDLLAGSMGWESGQQMLRELLAAAPLEGEIEARVNQRMLEEHNELVDPVEQQIAVEEALANEARHRFVAIELQHITKATQPYRLMLKAAKEAAIAMLGAKKLREIRPRAFAGAEGRAANEAMYAMRKGDAALATAAKRKQMLQGQLAAQALAAREEVRKALNDFEKFTRPDDKLLKGRNLDLVYAARAILGNYELGPANQEPVQSYLDKVRKYDPQLYEDLEPTLIDAARGARSWQDLTLDDFRMLRETVEALWHRSKTDFEYGRGKDKAELQVVLGELLGLLEVPLVGPGDEGAVTAKDRRNFKVLNLKANLTRIEHWCLAMDGGTPGPYTRHIWRPVKEGLNAYRHDKPRYVEKLRDLVAAIALPRVLLDGKRYGIGYTFGEDNGGIGIAELLGALLHDGNLSNQRKNLLSRGWADELEDGSIDTSRWDRFKAEMVKQGHLKKEHFRFLQAVWDLNEGLKPLIQKTNREVHGHYMEEIEAVPFTVSFPDGSSETYRGGYVPAAADLDLEPSARHQASLEGLQSDFRQQVTGTPRGFTKSRTGVVRKLDLDVRKAVDHIDHVLRFVHVQAAVLDVDRKILKNPEFMGAMNKVDPKAINDMLRPWLIRAATQVIEEPGKVEFVNDFWRFVRRNAGVAIMFGSVVNALQQGSGLSNALSMVQARHLRYAAWQARPGQGMGEKIAGWSKEMEERLKNQVGALQDDLNQMLLSSSWYTRAQRWTLRNAYFMQRAVQNQVDIVTWLGAYNQEMEKLGADHTDAEAHAEAVAAGDAAVRLTQSSSHAEDVAGYEVGSPFHRTWVMFSGYFNNVLNQIQSAQGLSAKARVALQAFVVPTMISAALATAFYGDNDNDDDSPGEEFAAWFFASMGKGAAGMVPGFGPAGVAAAEFVASPGGASESRIATNPSIGSAIASLRGARDLFAVVFQGKEVRGKQIRDFGTMVSIVTGIPVFSALSKPIGYQAEVDAGRVRPEGPLGPTVDYLRGLVTGRASEASRGR